MKLIIKRSQKAHTGIFGGHKGAIFMLNCRVVLTRKEHDLVEQYKAADHLLANVPEIADLRIEGMSPNKYGFFYTPSKLMKGVSHECKDVAVLLQIEEIIKDACRNFKILLDVMSTFDTEVVIEFPSIVR